jgi:hypothetical protein
MLVLVLAVCLLLVGRTACASDARQGAVSGAEPSTSTTSPDLDRLHFAAPEGWFTLEGEGLKNSGDVAWAANVPFAPEDVAAWELPGETIRELAPDGLVFWAWGPRSYTGYTEYGELDPPFTLANARLSTGQYETQISPHVAFAHGGVLVRDELLTVYVWFGSNPPSQALKAEANRILATLTIPAE